MLPALSWEVSGLPPCFTQNIYLYIYNLICRLHKISLALLNISTVLNSLKVIHLIQLLILQNSTFCTETELVTGSDKSRSLSSHRALEEGLYPIIWRFQVFSLYWMSTPRLGIRFTRILRLWDFVLCFRTWNSWLSTNKPFTLLDLFFSMCKDETEETSEPGGRKCCLRGTLWVKMWIKLPKAHESGPCLHKGRRVLLPVFAFRVNYPGH